MTVKHTPGPWEAEFHETVTRMPFGIVVGGIGKDGLKDTVICHGPHFRYEPISYQAFETGNAKLIAAAPDLLEVLLEIVGQEKPNRYGYDAAGVALEDTWRERARKAVNKAIGE